MPDAAGAAVLAGAACLAATVFRRRVAPGHAKIVASSKMGSLLKQLPTLQRGHCPPPLLPTGLLQSATVDAYNPPADATPWQRENIELPADEFSDRKPACCPPATPAGLVSLDWLDPASPSSSTPICLVIPSLTGDSMSPYMRRAAAALSAANVRVACYNPRGRGGNALFTPFMYSAGYTEDLRRVVRRIHERYPASPLVAIGYSLGGAYLTKLIAEDGDASPFAGAAALASPLDISMIAAHLNSTWTGRLIDRLVIAPTVRKTLKPYVEVDGAVGDLDAAKRSWTLQTIDRGVCAPQSARAQHTAWIECVYACTTHGHCSSPLCVCLFLSLSLCCRCSPR